MSLLQIGCALGFLIPPEIVPDDPDINVVDHRLKIMIFSTAGVCTFLFILVLLGKLLNYTISNWFNIVERCYLDFN